MTNIKLATLFCDVDLPKELAELTVQDITIDSRAVKHSSVFFALRGTSFNREQYIDDAFERGAVAVVREKTDENVTDQYDFYNSNPGQVVIFIPQLRVRLGEYAAKFFGEPSKKLSLVGVTGTNGKTSCADLLAQLWRALGYKAASLGTLGWSVRNDEYHSTGLTTLDAIENQRLMRFFLDKGITHVVMEVSSHGIDQGRVNALDFDVAVLTNISRDHLDYHATMDCYAAVKLGFVQSSKAAVINVDDAEIKARLSLFENKPFLSVSFNDQSAAVFVDELSFANAGVSAKVTLSCEAFNFNVPLMGVFNLYNLSLVLAVLFHLESASIDLDVLAAKIEQLKPVPGRLERIEGRRLVFIDYAHTPDALESVLVALRQHTSTDLYLVFGCGGDRDKGKRPLMAKIAERYASCVYLTTDNPRSEMPEKIMAEVASGFQTKEKIIQIKDRAEAIKQAIESSKEDTIVLIAGKGHENYQEINGVRYPFSDFEEVQRLIA